MKNKYIDLIEQSFEFPQEEFKVSDSELFFNNVPLMDLIKQYGTPLKITYLPKISTQIQRAKRLFNVAMAKVDYQGDYNYCYCTKSSHFSFVLEEALKNDINIETSSAFDINLINELYEQGKITNKDIHIICNGFKRPQYIENIAELINKGFSNTIPIIDNKEEMDLLEANIKEKCKIGIRIATEEEAMFEFYTSRLGLRFNDIVDFYIKRIKRSRFEVKMLHFFINTGIKDTAHYWNELTKAVNVYCELKKVCPSLSALNIGGGFPFKNSLAFNYDYEYMAEEMIAQIQQVCNSHGVVEPEIFTEFGSYTVSESGAVLYSIINQKQQNDRELWYMIDSSFMTTLPDIWGINQRFIMLAINNWDHEYQRVFLGGLTCDSQDFYNSERHSNAVFLPKLQPETPQYVGFFHTGAYQESLGGYGGIQHCLTPAPKHILIDVDENGEYFTKLFAKEQSHKSMLKILGY